MKTTISILFCLIFDMLGVVAYAQKVPLNSISKKLAHGQAVNAADFGLKAYEIPNRDDTVRFYTYQYPGTQPHSIYLFLPGTNAENIYTYHRGKGGSYWYSALGSFDFSFLPKDYLYIIVAKPGFGLLGNGDSKIFPKAYWQKTSLDDRVMRANAALNYALKHLVKAPRRTVVFGYSEGFYVGAKLASMNKHITHLGIGGGGGYPDLYDFILFNLKAAQKQQMNPDTAIAASAQAMADFSKIMLHPADTTMIYDYSYKRWASFSTPPINYLSKVNIPIYQVHGILDDNTPIENAYIVPVEFTRLGKTNLTFKAWPNCDHSLIEHLKDGKETHHWDDMIKDFFEWVELH